MPHTTPPMMDTAPVETRLRAARLAAGYSQEALAGRAGIGRATVERIETGRSPRPRIATRRVLADALGVKVADLWPEPYDRQLAAYVEQEPAE